MRTTAERTLGTPIVWVTFVTVTAMMFLATVADASRTVRNSVRGAAIGAGVGALIDGGNGARTGAAAGAVAGAVARR